MSRLKLWWLTGLCLAGSLIFGIAAMKGLIAGDADTDSLVASLLVSLILAALSWTGVRIVRGRRAPGSGEHPH